MAIDLHVQRLAAAMVTRGTSLDPIHRATLAQCAALGLKGGLLEFGAGSGRLAGLLLGSGYQGTITCADILPRPEGLPPGVTWIETDLNEPLPVAAGAFDAIVSTEVIEHLENPRATFREFRRLLRTGGTLIVTTPNQESIRSLAALLLGRHFAAFLGASYPAHITALLEKDLERICAETGFRPPRFSYTDFGGLPKLPHVTWQRLSGGLLRGRLFSDNLVLLTTGG